LEETIPKAIAATLPKALSSGLDEYNRKRKIAKDEKKRIGEQNKHEA
jgi:hypothetical protein